MPDLALDTKEPKEKTPVLYPDLTPQLTGKCSK